jgi:hypothetical protein
MAHVLTGSHCSTAAAGVDVKMIMNLCNAGTAVSCCWLHSCLQRPN